MSENVEHGMVKIITDPPVTCDEQVRKLEFALVRAISALELVEANSGQVMSFKRLIRELKMELRRERR